LTDTLPSCPECGAVLSDPADHSDPARRRYFAIMREAWENLPDHWRTLLPTSEHLRKHALCRVGWCETTVATCGSNKAAIEVAALARKLDTYAVVDIRGSVVTVSTARSQAKRSQPKKPFLECADKVYMVLSEMLGTDITQAKAAA
jgi:hypothetical protein